MNVFLVKAVVSVAGVVVAAIVAYKTYYSSKNKEKPMQCGEPRSSPSRCPMCLKDFKNFQKKILLPCKHLMHQYCAKILFTQKENSCPECRKKISLEFLEAHFIGDE